MKIAKIAENVPRRRKLYVPGRGALRSRPSLSFPIEVSFDLGGSSIRNYQGGSDPPPWTDLDPLQADGQTDEQTDRWTDGWMTDGWTEGKQIWGR